MAFWNRAPKSDRLLFISSMTLLIVSLTLVGLRDRRIQAASEDEEFYRFVDVAAEVYSEIRAKYVDEVEPRRVLEGALMGMFNALDEHSQYMDPDMLKSLEKDTSGEFSGIGINISQRQGVLTVIAPIPGSPAAEAGLMPWDRIIEIEGVTTKGMDLPKAVEMLTGPAGTKVTFKVFRHGQRDPLEFTVTRGNISIDSVFWKTLDDNIGYIRIARFSENTTRDVRRAILEMKKQGVEGMVLDLRLNSGGLLREAIDVSDLLLEKGDLIVATKGRVRGQNREYYSTNEPITRVPLFVLVNEGSASASEIVAGAIQDHRRGVVLGPAGKNTFGKGSVQTIANLSQSMLDDPNGNPMESALRLTTARYYTPSGRTIHNVGVTPDIGIPLTDRHELELIRHGLFGDVITGEDYHLPDDPEEQTQEQPQEPGRIQLNGQPNQPPVEEEDPSKPFYDVPPPTLLDSDDFVDVMLEEAVKQMKIYMILQKGTDRLAEPERVASRDAAAAVGMSN